MLDLLVPVALAAPGLLVAATLRRGRRIVGALGAVLLAATLTYHLARSTTFSLAAPTIDRVPTSAPLVALTLDDGPTPEYTDRVLDLLDVAGARATFFVTGRELEPNLALGREIVRRGHELGNHSFSHERMVGRSLPWIAEELERTDLAIRVAGQGGPIPFRPPYGKKLLALGLVARRFDRALVTWDVAPDDDPGRSPREIADAVVANARPGSIVLLHVMYPSRENSRLALPLVVEGLAARGLRVVRLSELLASAGER